jgi:hypothetical protein
MISYVTNYEVGNKPYICKVFTASSGEEFHTAINFSNETERKEVSQEVILGHLDNILTYINDRSNSLDYVKLDEPVNNEPWPLKGWKDLQWANEEINIWWHFLYYKEEEEEDHTHDPETGDEIPNA